MTISAQTLNPQFIIMDFIEKARNMRSRSGVDTEDEPGPEDKVAKLEGNTAFMPALVPKTSPQIERRWLVILAIDIVGYSRLIELDDLATALRVRDLRLHLVLPVVLTHHGWIVSLAGDGMLIAFTRSTEAVKCAVALQRALNLAERLTPKDYQFRLRMGISADDVLVINGEMYGRALNVAARLEKLAEPGDVYLSEEVFYQVNHRIGVQFEALGEQVLRNTAKLVRIRRVARTELAIADHSLSEVLCYTPLR